MQSVVSTTNSYSYIFSQWLHPPPVCQSTPSDSIHPSNSELLSLSHRVSSRSALSLTNSLHSKSMHTIYRGTLCQGEQMYKINILAVCLLSCKPWFRNHINQGTAWLRPGKGGRGGTIEGGGWRVAEHRVGTTACGVRSRPLSGTGRGRARERHRCPASIPLVWKRRKSHLTCQKTCKILAVRFAAIPQAVRVPYNGSNESWWIAPSERFILRARVNCVWASGGGERHTNTGWRMTPAARHAETRTQNSS